MNDVSNRTLIYLLMVAIVISLVGTLVSLSKLGELGVTGFAGASNSTGQVNLTVGDTCSIIMSGDDVNFGTGGINHSSGCQLNTSNGYKNIDGCGDGILASNYGLNFTNTGNQNISLNITVNVTAAILFGGTSPSFKINANNTESGACNDGNFALGNWVEVTQDNSISVSNSSNTLAADDTKDDIEIDVYLSIPQDANQGGGSALIKMIGIC